MDQLEWDKNGEERALLCQLKAMRCAFMHDKMYQLLSKRETKIITIFYIVEFVTVLINVIDLGVGGGESHWVGSMTTALVALSAYIINLREKMRIPIRMSNHKTVYEDSFKLYDFISNELQLEPQKRMNFFKFITDIENQARALEDNINTQDIEPEVFQQWENVSKKGKIREVDPIALSQVITEKIKAISVADDNINNGDNHNFKRVETVAHLDRSNRYELKGQLDPKAEYELKRLNDS
jgi:hypothetical protein